jgi:hypothetical protein
LQRELRIGFCQIGEALTATGTPGAKEAAQAYFARNGCRMAQRHKRT